MDALSIACAAVGNLARDVNLRDVLDLEVSAWPSQRVQGDLFLHGQATVMFGGRVAS